MFFVLELIVKPGADIFVHRFQFDENQGKAVDEADQVGPPVNAERERPGSSTPERRESGCFLHCGSRSPGPARVLSRCLVPAIRQGPRPG